jgi:cobalt-zinc-cadmium efflux system outer membrane protein
VAVHRTITIPLLLCLVSTNPRAQTQSPSSDALTLEAAVARAMAANPALLAARAQRAVAEAAVDVARERPNPEGRFEVERETPRESFTVAVRVELGGKRAGRVAVGQAGVQLTDAETAVVAVAVRASVRQAYFDRLAADETLHLQQEVERLATQARDAARDRFQAGSAPRLDVLQAELALEETLNQTSADRAAAEAARVTLNALLALPTDAHPTLSTAFDAGTPPEADARSIVSADLLVLDRRIDEASARVSLARALQVPDLTPEAAITHGSEPEFTTGWRAAVAVTVPLFTRHRAGIQVEAATLAALRLERSATAARLGGELAVASTLAASRRAQYIAFRDSIVPKAVEVERMAQDAYRLGETALAPLLQALQASRDVRRRALVAGVEYQRALGDLEKLLGAPKP